MRAFDNYYHGRRVLVTGHTGFKGAWLCEWLLSLGADVTGFALGPLTTPALSDQLGLCSRVRNVTGDVRDLASLNQIVFETKPEAIFHLAAQPLVRQSYREPVETFATNVMGTVNLLEAVRQSKIECSIVIVTTDKCYENLEWLHAYRENDRIGGYDPYSASKGATEIAVAAYRRSFFNAATSNVRLASARAGNVIGGGDWAIDRIVPDSIRHLKNKTPIPVRNKSSTRPWQHVLEPLSGYLLLMKQLAVSNPSQASPYAGAFNFGPALSSNRTVVELVTEMLRHWPGEWMDCSDPASPHEARLLNLATEKAYHMLAWKPVWDFEKTVQETVIWYRAVGEGRCEAHALTLEQIAAYTADASKANLPWASRQRN